MHRSCLGSGPSRLAALLITSFTAALTGARALWRGSQPSTGARIYFANHSSHGDFVLLWSSLPPDLRARTHPVAGADYWNKGCLRRFIINDVFKGVLINRRPGSAPNDAIAQMSHILSRGDSLILFPEGTRNQGDTLLPFRGGLYHLARACPDAELIPVWIDNLKRVMPKGRTLPLPLLVTLSFGEPVQLGDDETKEHFLERAREALLTLSKEDK
ncbi:1-acyl-sn-glycerol-3-phosphate acyltransferase (plasmid) [Pseudomonas luteola]|uniref:lysophospholipid acyltransferase family protein n=1 Tax=Pseudomonas luteola TaxID=47886 RepID=UPI003D9FF217